MTDFGSGGARRKKGVQTPMIAWVVVGLVLLALIGGGVWMVKASEYRVAQQAIASREMVLAFSQVLDDDPAKVISTTAKAKGAAGAIEAAAKQLCSHIAKDDWAMAKELEALDLDRDDLQPTADGGFEIIGKVREQIAAGRKVVARYRDLRERRVAAFRAAVAKAGMSTAERETMMNRFDEALEVSFFDSPRLWRVRDEVLRETGELIAIMERTRPTWTRGPYGVMYLNAGDYREYDAQRWKVNSARWELKELNSKGRKNARAVLEAARRSA